MTLLQVLRTNKKARKIFGERELRIVEKQLLGINLSQSEKNRLSRDIRKKFEFISEVMKFSDEFKIKKGSEIDRLVAETIETIREDELFRRIKRIVLFGSSVENQRSFRSDIDIAVEFSIISAHEAMLFRKRILGGVNKIMDIQVYNNLPEKVKNEINKKGRIMYERKD